ncbi:NUDIX domain-containing protein [Marinirhabdus gelatinilytica]|uniref:GDP-mannose pyrophosphatase n=1 Tax=Marinirhabdus gelatinilytica TaxID=1703343 RepID=A0A370Q7Z3_9FLAO|nr:NUDIX hydrolase [Marinirhabdus gelatinilytica]RDK84170.1 ADP-ribose pyrophosphatase [Marinirhabdus gelatinilytica]
MDYTINNEEVVFDNHYKMLKANVSYDTFSGDNITTTRFAFHRGDSVAILLFEKDSSSILLTKQFRYPTTRHDEGWIFEIPAGSMEKDECPLTCIIRETEEEMGYKVYQPNQISNFYTSPGGSTERCYLFYAEVTPRDKTSKGGGMDSENEDIKTVKLPISEMDSWLSEKIFDAKTIIALQWFMAHKI